MSINVTFQTIDVELIQGVVFDYVRGKGSLESLRPKLRRYWDTFNIYYPFKQMVNDAIRKNDPRIPNGFDGEVFQWRHFFIVETESDRVAELLDLYQNAPDDETVLRLVREQLAILDPLSSTDPKRWVPKPLESRWNIDEQVQQALDHLTDYVVTPDGREGIPLDNDFTSQVLRINEALAPTHEADDYPLEAIGGWATKEFRKLLKPPDELFRPLFKKHPELKTALQEEGRYPWSGAGMYIKPANVPKFLDAVIQSLEEEQARDDPNEFVVNALIGIADLLRYAKRVGHGFIERCA